MGIKEEIKSLLAKEGVTMTDIAFKLSNSKNKRVAMSSLSQKLSNETIKYKDIKQIADILGYDIKFEKIK